MQHRLCSLFVSEELASATSDGALKLQADVQSDAEPPASPPALVLRCLGAVGRKVFLACWHRGGGGEGWEQRRRRDLARPVPQRGRVWFPHGRPGELYCCNLGRTFLQPQNGSFSTLKQLLNLHPVVILRPWECWVKAPFDGVF